MPTKLNKFIVSEEEVDYNSNVKTYSGFYFDTLSFKSVNTQSPWTSIAVNDSNGFMLAVASGTTTTNNLLMYSNNGGESWANISTITGVNNWRSITFGNGRFVGVSASGTAPMRSFYTSGSFANAPTGTSSFSYVTFGIENNNWESVTYGNGYFVAVASSGNNRFMKSKDGITWQSISQSNLNSNAWDSVTYSPELKRFVAVCRDNSGRITYSNFNPDVWNFSSNQDSFDLSIINYPLNHVMWMSKLKSFLAVGNSGKVLSSNDGIIWTSVKFNDNVNFSHSIWSQELELIVLVANTGDLNRAYTGHLLSPTDNNLWTKRGLLQVNNWTTGIWNRKFGVFVILSSDGVNNRILTSKISGLNHFLDKKYYYDLLDSVNLTNFSYYNSNIRVSVGRYIETYPVLNELYDFSFFTNDILPKGLTLNPINGEIIGTVQETQLNKTYTIFAKNESQVISAQISFYISSKIEKIVNFNYTESDIFIDLVDEINLLPIIDQGTDYLYSYQAVGVNNFNSFPKGINFNTFDGRISGTPQNVQSTIPYIISIKNSLETINKIINLTVYVLKTIIESGDLRGRLDIEGEWQGYVSYFYNITNIIGGKIQKNYFYDNNGKISFNRILTLGTRRSVSKINNIIIYKKELVFTILGQYNLDNLESLVLNSYTFLFSNVKKQLDSNGNTQFIWDVDEESNYFQFKDNVIYIRGKDSFSLIPLQSLKYQKQSITTLVGSSIGSNIPTTATFNYDTWNIRNNNIINKNWRSIVWSSKLSIFVAVSFDSVDNNQLNNIMISSNGINWTNVSTATAVNFQGVTWSPKLEIFVAIGNSSESPPSNLKLITSSNGINWSVTTSPVGAAGSIIWSPELEIFLAVGNDLIFTSVDGINWISRNPSISGNHWWHSTWSPQLGIFVVVARSGTTNSLFMTSTNGINWVTRTSPGTGNWVSVDWSPQLEIFVAVATNGQIVTSSNGITWILRNSPVNNAWRSVAWGYELGIFAVVGSSGSNNRIIISEDGINWVTKNNIINNSWQNITYSPELRIFVAVSSDVSGDTTGTQVITSTTPIDTFSNDFSILPSLPNNYLFFDNKNGEISGTTTPYSNDITYTVTAKNKISSISTNFRIRNIYSNTNINTGYNNTLGLIKEGFIKNSIGSIVDENFGKLEINSFHYEWTTNGPIFNFIISGTYYFPESSLKSIKIGLQSDSTRFITDNSTYNSGTGRGYNYSGYSNYVIGNINYSKWSWTFPGSLQTGSNADTDYGWRLGNNFTPPNSYTSQVISIFIE
jgi:hypothetical protein